MIQGTLGLLPGGCSVDVGAVVKPWAAERVMKDAGVIRHVLNANKHIPLRRKRTNIAVLKPAHLM